jgi:hypothetical protein
MSKHFLYSTNVFLKLLIYEKYRNDLHYVWCSEDFDSKKLAPYTTSGSLTPPSANPADIYRELERDVKGGDGHSAKITSQRASLMVLAVDWEQKGIITQAQKSEIVHMLNNASFDLWKPLLYIIPRSLVEPRLQLVPIEKRAGFGAEYILSDLHRSEFDVVEV